MSQRSIFESASPTMILVLLVCLCIDFQVTTQRLDTPHNFLFHLTMHTDTCNRALLTIYAIPIHPCHAPVLGWPRSQVLALGLGPILRIHHTW